MDNQGNNPSPTEQPAVPSVLPVPQVPNTVTIPPANEAQPPAPSSGQTSAPSLDNVEGGYGAFIRKRWWLFLGFIVVSAVVIYLSPIIGIFIFVAGVSYIKHLYENALFSAFAVTNHFSYQKDGFLDTGDGMLFKLGRGGQFHDIVEGTYKQWPLALFVYVYVIGEGRSSHTYRRAVMLINFTATTPTSTPAFILRRHRLLQMMEEEGESLKANGYTQKVNLEANFSQHFQVYIRPNTQVDVLAILTPDVMQLLIGLEKYEVEMTQDGKLYIYSRNYITKKQELIDMYQIVEAITPKIGRDVNREAELSTVTQQAVVNAVV